MQFHPGKLQQACQISGKCNMPQNFTAQGARDDSKVKHFCCPSGESEFRSPVSTLMIYNCLQPKLQEIRNPVLILVSVHTDAYKKGICT